MWRQLVRCAVNVGRLLIRREVHLDHRLVREARLPDGRRFHVFRQTSCTADTVADGSEPVVLAVWFHLRGVPGGSRVRRWLFERESILNTLLYAGVDGYRVKLWMVDPVTCDYAGLYEWSGTSAAEHYGRYISAVLRPLSVPGTVGYQLLAGTSLRTYLDGAGSS